MTTTQVLSSAAQRNTAIDIAKGLLMIFVVITHSGSDISKYLLWFHAPGFFALSGFFFRKPSSPNEAMKRTMQLIPVFFIPYFTYLFLLDLPALIHFCRSQQWEQLSNEIWILLYGGRKLQGIYAAFWFVPVLFFCRALVSWLSIYLSEGRLLTVLLLLFLLASLESYYFHLTETIIDVPLNLDVVPVAAFYYYSGYLMSKFLGRVKNGWYILIAVICAGLVWGCEAGWINIAIDLKYTVYYQPIVVIAASLLFIVLILKASAMAEKIPALEKLFSFIGYHSLTIMYLHVFVNIIIKLKLGVQYNTLVFTLIGIVVPLVFSIVINRWKLTRIFFLGKDAKREVTN